MDPVERPVERGEVMDSVRGWPVGDRAVRGDSAQGGEVGRESIRSVGTEVPREPKEVREWETGSRG